MRTILQEDNHWASLLERAFSRKSALLADPVNRIVKKIEIIEEGLMFCWVKVQLRNCQINASGNECEME